MRYLLWIITLVISIDSTYGQHTEFSVQAGSGLFLFGGPGSAEITGIAIGGGAIINPYGHESGFSYSLTGQVQRVTKAKSIYGFQARYESLTSQVPITYIVGDIGPNIAANGQVTLQNQFVSLSPLAGRRFSMNHVNIDLTVGMDIGIGLSAYEHAKWTENSGFYASDYRNRYPIPDVDFRPRLNLTGYYHAFGLSVGYSHGLTNYTTGQYGNGGAYSRFWRAGVVYRFGGQT